MVEHKLDLYSALRIQHLAAQSSGDAFGPSPEAIRAAGHTVQEFKKSNPLADLDKYYAIETAKLAVVKK